MTTRALLYVLFFCFLAVIQLASAGETDKRTPLGTMRFGKRESFVDVDDEMDYNGLDKRSLEEETQRSIRAPLGTMRFGKRAPLGTMRFGKRAFGEGPLGTMRFGKRDPFGTMRFGK